MTVAANSSSVEFYQAAINALLEQMGNETNETKIDQMHGNVLRLSSKMADAAFADIRNRTANLSSLVWDLNRITAEAGGESSAASIIAQLTNIADLAAEAVAAATQGGE